MNPNNVKVVDFNPVPTQSQEVPMNLNTLFPNFNPTSMLNVWWDLPTNVQEMVKGLVPDQDSWTLHLTKDKSEVWVFSLPQFLTFNESLCNGTELVLDYYYEKLSGKVSKKGDKMTLVVTDTKPEQFTCKSFWVQSDPLWPESNEYCDSETGMLVWLCPYLQVLFKGVPENLYFNMEVTM